MEKKENKILDELRRHGPMFVDPCPMPVGFLGKLIGCPVLCSSF